MNILLRIVLPVLLLSACGTEISLPPAKPLSASAEQLAAIPNLAPGPHAVLKTEPMEWQDLRVRIVRPQNAGPFPLIVFSHGFASGITQYDALFEHWASHGYVVVAPYHLDGGGLPRAIFNSVRKGNEGLVAARVSDVQKIIAHLDDLELPVDKTRIAVAGHSFGAFTAQQFGGAASVNSDNGQRIEGRDARVRAVVSVSPPGEMFKVINAKSWTQMDTPMLATTGTWDIDGRFVTDWRQHRLSYESARPGKNWLLVIEGADHYLGNLICRPERKQPPQTDALRMVNALSVTFLNAHLRDDAQARAFLAQRPLQQLTGGFAALEQR